MKEFLHEPGTLEKDSLLVDSVRRWLPVTLFVSITAYAATRAAGQITDPDTWWHIRLGNEFRAGWSLSDPGQLSPFATQPWVATQWTLELVASLVYDWAGLGGIAVLTGLGTALLAAVLWKTAREWASPLPAATAASLALMGALPVIAPRPQLASLVLVGIFVLIWRRTSEDLKLRWWLVPLSWIWAATHGFWFLGALIGFAVVGGLILDRKIAGRAAAKMAMTPVFMLVAAAFTPAGPKLLLAPFMVSGISEFITEWQPPDFRSPFVLVVGAMAAIVILTAGRRGLTSWSDLLLLLLAGMLLVYAARTVAVAGVLLVPLAASSIQSWVGGPQGKTQPGSAERLFVRAAFAVTGLGVLLAGVLNSPYRDPYPVVINDALEKLPTDAVVWNDYAFGGWLALRHPELAHGIDGMTEAYPAQYVSDYIDAQRLRVKWQATLKRVGATHAFLPARDALALELQQHLQWRVIEKTRGYVVLENPTSGPSQNSRN